MKRSLIVSLGQIPQIAKLTIQYQRKHAIDFGEAMKNKQINKQ